MALRKGFEKNLFETCIGSLKVNVGKNMGKFNFKLVFSEFPSSSVVAKFLELNDGSKLNQNLSLKLETNAR